MAKPLVIVPGGMNTDIIGLGVERLLSPGELTLGGQLRVGPGGKARNMAQMAAAYLGTGMVAMIGRTSRDPFGLWQVPLQALEAAGVDSTHIKVLDFEEAGRRYPGIALIPVDRGGRNQIYVLPGVNADFSAADVDAAETLFLAEDRTRILLLAMEIPLPTVLHCLEKAKARNIPAILDPGGLRGPEAGFLDDRIFLLKPNEHEASLLTGCAIEDFSSAAAAADFLLRRGVQNVLITHGARGAYFFNSSSRFHVPVPQVPASGVCDETGCGDQVSALLAACLAEGRAIEEAVKRSVLGGTLQFHRAGIQPVTPEELNRPY
jgi:ribokinase